MKSTSALRSTGTVVHSMGSISALHVCFAKGVMHSAGGNSRASALPCCHAGARCSAGHERTGCPFPRHLYMLGNGRKWLASTLGACSGALLACKCWVPCRSQAPQQLYVVQTPPEGHATAVQAPGDLMSWTDSWRIRLAVRPRKAGHASQLCLAAVQASDCSCACPLPEGQHLLHGGSTGRQASSVP